MSNDHIQTARPQQGGRKRQRNNQQPTATHVPNWGWVRRQWDEVPAHIVAKAVDRLSSDFGNKGLPVG